MSKVAEGCIALTQAQQRQYDEDGFFLVENALSQSEVNELLGLVDTFHARYCAERNLDQDDAFQMRNIVAAHERFKALMTHEKLLPLVVDVIGYNIQLRTSHMDVRPPMKKSHAEQVLGARRAFSPGIPMGPISAGPPPGKPCPIWK